MAAAILPDTKKAASDSYVTGRKNIIIEKLTELQFSLEVAGIVVGYDDSLDLDLELFLVQCSKSGCGISRGIDSKTLKTKTRISFIRKDLKSLPTGIGVLKWLKALAVGANDLKDLPEELTLLSQLRRLDISNNNFESVPKVVETLANLEFLNVSCNKLKTLSPGLMQLRRLRELDASGNSIKSVHADVRNLTSLEVLDLSSNHLVSLPRQVKQLSRLTTLRLSSNPRLLSLPKELKTLNLKCLTVGPSLHDDPAATYLKNIYRIVGDLLTSELLLTTPARAEATEESSCPGSSNGHMPENEARYPLPIPESTEGRRSFTEKHPEFYGCCGFLYQKSTASFLGRHPWNRRFWIMCPYIRKIRIFAKEHETEPIWMIPLDAVKRVEAVAEGKRKHDLRFNLLLCGGWVFELKANSTCERKRWCLCIEGIIKDLKHQDLVQPFESQPFWHMHVAKKLCHRIDQAYRKDRTDDRLFTIQHQINLANDRERTKRRVVREKVRRTSQSALDMMAKHHQMPPTERTSRRDDSLPQIFPATGTPKGLKIKPKKKKENSSFTSVQTTGRRQTDSRTQYSVDLQSELKSYSLIDFANSREISIDPYAPVRYDTKEKSTRQNSKDLEAIFEREWTTRRIFPGEVDMDVQYNICITRVRYRVRYKFTIHVYTYV
ncbi:hypothetical protein AAMO2058_000522400 [Amorphochlora amoebiformis]